jgi:hypothetical protein
VAIAAEDQARASREEVGATLEEVRLVREQLELAQAQLALGQDQMAVSRAALDASVRPLLVETTLMDAATSNSCYDFGEHIELEVSLRNVGAGPAFIVRAMFANGSLYAEGWSTHNVVPPGEVAYISAKVEPSDVGFGVWKQSVPHAAFRLAVEYTDLAGRQPTQTLFTLQRPDPNDAVVIALVEVYEMVNGTRALEPTVRSGSQH